MKKVTLISLLLYLLFACSDENESHSSVYIRVRNTSSVNYTDVFVNTSGGEFTYGNVNVNDTSPYHPYESAYRYAYVSLKIDGVEHRIQPIDYVGEEYLANGVYTYEIAARAGDGPGKLSMTLVRD